MIRLGNYHTESGEDYDCIFYPERKEAIAVGPIDCLNKSQARGPKFSVKATSEREAKEKLANKIGKGNF